MYTERHRQKIDVQLGALPAPVLFDRQGRDLYFFLYAKSKTGRRASSRSNARAIWPLNSPMQRRVGAGICRGSPSMDRCRASYWPETELRRGEDILGAPAVRAVGERDILDRNA
ncbi:MAG: hypothetical protein CME16_03570 [Gemmatimonadetes bacterium]|nr:hypothetical protein [Gemmatimonadota bacterium]